MLFADFKRRHARWTEILFQFRNLNAVLAPSKQIDCAASTRGTGASRAWGLVDFHEGGGGLAQSKIDNFRVEVCSAP